MTQAKDIEAVNEKAKSMYEATGVFPEMAIVARELAREKRKAEERVEELEQQLIYYKTQAHI